MCGPLSSRWFRLVVAFAMLVAGCGGGGGEPGAETGSSSTSATSSSTTAPPSGPPRPAGDERDLGPGNVVALSPDGRTALVISENPDSKALGCEGMPDPFLFLAPLDGEKRSVATPGTEPVAGDVLPRPRHAGQAAVVDQCEGFLTAVYLADQAGDGRLSRVQTVPLPDEDQPAARLSWSIDGRYLLGVRPEAGEIVRIDPASGEIEVAHDHLPGVLLAVELAGGEIALLQPERLLVGDRSIPVRAYGLSVAPNGRDLAVYGQDGLLLVVSDREPLVVEHGTVTDVAWSPNGRAVTYLSDLNLRSATTTGQIGNLADDAASAGVFTPDGQALVFTRTRPIEEGVELSVSFLPLAYGDGR
jgi:hypothetical protein